MMRKSETLLALLGFAVLVTLFFLPRLLNPPGLFFGALQEQYYLLGQYAYDHQILRALAAGYFPLWNPDNALGHPFLGDMLSAILFPLKLLIYLVPTPAMREFFLLLRIFLAAFFTYAFARRHLSKPAAILAAIAFAFTGYFQFFINENYLNAETLIPLLLILADRLHERGRILDLGLLGLAGFAVFTNGHPEAAFYVTLFIVLYYVVAPAFCRCPLKNSLRLAAALLIGLCLASPMLLPFLEYWSRGFHFHLPGAGFYHYDLREAAALVSPWFFPPPAPGAAYYRPVEWHWELGAQGLPPYAGTIVPWLIPAVAGITLLLALSRFIPIRKSVRATGLFPVDNRVLFFTAFALFFLAVMFGLPGFRLIGFVPLFNFSGNFKHPMPEAAFALAYLAGAGLDRILSRLDSRRARTGLAAIAIILLLAELQAAGRWLKPFDPGYLKNLQHTAAIRRLQSETAPFRAYVADRLLPPNLNLYFHFADLRVMDGINDRRLVEAINAINGHDRTQAGNYWYQEVGYLQPRPEALGSPVLDTWNLKYVLAASAGHTAQVIPPQFIAVSREPFVGGELVLWQRPRAYPRAWLEKAPGAPPGEEVKISADSAEKVYLRIQIPGPVPSIVVLADLYYPGWEAEVNGQPVRIERVHGLLRAVPVPAQPSEVVFRYRPASFALGLWLALTSFCSLFFVCLFRQWQISSNHSGRG